MSVSIYEEKTIPCPCGKGKIVGLVDINSLFTDDEFVSMKIQCPMCSVNYTVVKTLDVSTHKSSMKPCRYKYFLKMKTTSNAIEIDPSSFTKEIIQIDKNDLDKLIYEHNRGIIVKYSGKVKNELLESCSLSLKNAYVLLSEREKEQYLPEDQYSLALLIEKISGEYQNKHLPELDLALVGHNRFLSSALFWAANAVSNGLTKALILEKRLLQAASEDIEKDYILEKALLLKSAELGDVDGIRAIAEEYTYKHSKLFNYDLEEANHCYKILISHGEIDVYPKYIYNCVELGKIVDSKTLIIDALKLNNGELNIEIYKTLHSKQWEKIDDLELEIYVLTQAINLGIYAAQQLLSIKYKKTILGKYKRSNEWKSYIN